MTSLVNIAKRGWGLPDPLVEKVQRQVLCAPMQHRIQYNNTCIAPYKASHHMHAHPCDLQVVLVLVEQGGAQSAQ
jgi:hypothetical protein